MANTFPQALQALLQELLEQRCYVIEFAFHFDRLEKAFEQGVDPLEVAGLDPVWLRKAEDLRAKFSPAFDQARRFAQEKDLAALDRAFGLCASLRFDFEELLARGAHLFSSPPSNWRTALEAPPREGRDWQQRWGAEVTRHQGLTTVDFKCRTCGWEFRFVSEVGSAEEAELPFEELECPECTGEVG